jgi:hypothetical protein
MTSGAFLADPSEVPTMADARGLGQFDHPAWLTAAGTAGGYVALLVLMTILLFGIPYLLFSLL